MCPLHMSELCWQVIERYNEQSAGAWLRMLLCRFVDERGECGRCRRQQPGLLHRLLQPPGHFHSGPWFHWSPAPLETPRSASGLFLLQYVLELVSVVITTLTLALTMVVSFHCMAMDRSYCSPVAYPQSLHATYCTCPYWTYLS